jgi:molybdopterin adenylyltransferase
VSAQLRVAILTVSDAGSRGERADTSGDRIAEWTSSRGYVIAARELVPDDTVEIVRALLRFCDEDIADVVFTTGGTGLSARDVTPEATRAIAEREVPGIAELMRAAIVQSFPRAALSRAIVVQRAATIVVNLPGSPGGVSDGLAVAGDLLEHAVQIARGRASGH